MRRLLLAAGAVAILMSMTGCVEPGPPDTPSPTASVPPVFASEEEALAAAEEAYAAYVALADQILAEGGADPERLSAVASGDFLELSIDGFERVQANGWRSIGQSTFDSVELQSFDPTGGHVDVVTVYLCDDVSGVDVVDASGASVVSPDRPERTFFQVTFDLAESGGHLLVSGQEVWSDGGC